MPPFQRLSRRDFCKTALALPLALRASASAAAEIPHTVGGLHWGVETFNFHDAPPAGDPQLIPTIIRGMQYAQIPECEIMYGHVEPWSRVATGWWVQTRTAPGFTKMREDARHWRLTVPMDYYVNIRKQFEAVGLRIYYYNINFNEMFTDTERDRSFEAAKALGAYGISSSTVSERSASPRAVLRTSPVSRRDAQSQ